MKRDNLPLLFLLWGIQVGLIALVQWAPLFWDNVLLTGRIPTFYLDTLCTFQMLPEEMAGYPPLWGYYIAGGWALLGRSLAATHWLMLPLLWGISYQTVVLLQTFLPRRAMALSAITMMGLPVLLSLQSQAGPDLALIWLYLSALNAVLARARGWLAAYLVLLALISPRGAVGCLSLFLIDQAMVGPRFFSFQWLWAASKAMAFIPAALAFLSWYGLQKAQYGWWFNNPQGEWAQAAGYAPPLAYLKNLAVSVWRMIDFGQAAIFIGLLAFLPSILRGTAPEARHRLVLSVLFLVPALVFTGFFSLFQNPIGHRYLILPVYFACLWLLHELAERYRYDRFVMRVLVLWLFFATGHWWVALYPQGVAKGWDGTLTHLNFLITKRSAFDFLKRKEIPLHKVGATFPNLDPLDATLLNGDTARMHPARTGQSPYVLFTTASNEFEVEDVARLEAEYLPVFESSAWPVRTVVYRKKP